MPRDLLGLLPFVGGGAGLFVLGFACGFALRAWISRRRRRRWAAAQVMVGQAR